MSTRGRTTRRWCSVPEGANRAAVLHGPGDLRIEERPVPSPGPHEALLEILAVGICGSDVHYYEHGRIGSRVVTQPLVLGHETCGRVIALGSDVSKLRVGQRVCVEPGVPCGTCRDCRAGRYNVCAEVRFHGTPPIDGSLTRYLAVNEDFAFPLPASVSNEAGALIEPLAVAVWACRKARVSAGDRVLVTGAGPIGLLVAQTARALGAGMVGITDVAGPRLEFALGLAFEEVHDAASPMDPTDPPFDALIECSGSPAALDGALQTLRPGGVAVLVGMGADHVSIPVDLLQRRELWLTGTFRYANVYPAAISLAAGHRVKLEPLITGRFDLEHTEAALRAGRQDPRAIKSVVEPAGRDG
jgi:L-iditol 2-dehydrogenase